ncbi:MAG TPA: hypothetical protein PKX74_20765 [Leptospiraceae bacterium]|nr:hypothetical protein [Leptospiraceae bacterium]
MKKTDQAAIEENMRYGVSLFSRETIGFASAVENAEGNYMLITSGQSKHIPIWNFRFVTDVRFVCPVIN